MELERSTLTVEEAGELLGISRAPAYEMARTGRLPMVRTGNRIAVPKKGKRKDTPQNPTASIVELR